MALRFVVVVVCLRLSLVVQGQTGHFDSLRVKWLHSGSDDERIENYDKWLSTAIRINHDSIDADLQYVDRQRKLYNSPFLNAVYLSNYAYRFAEKTGDYQQGLILAQEARLIFEKGNHIPQLVNCLCRIAFFKLWNEIGSDRSELSESVLNDYLLPAAKLAESYGQKELQIIAKQWLASYYSVSKKDYLKALAIFKEAELLHSANVDPLLYITTLASIGIIYSDLRDESNALIYLNKTIAAPFSSDYPYAICNLYRSLSGYYLDCTKELDKALIYGTKSYELAQTLKAPEYLALSQKRMYEVYKEIGDGTKALEFLELYDSTESRISREKFEFAYAHYDLQNKENIILQQALVLQRKNNYIIVLTSLFFLVLGGFFLLYQVRRKNKLLALRESEELNRQRLENAVRESEEEERKRISENLHDSVVQKMVVAKMNVESLQRMVGESSGQAQIIHNIHMLLEDSTTEIRKISHTIMPASFEKDGLGRVVEELGYRLLNTNIKPEIFTKGNFNQVPKNISIVVYRIIQEALQNVLKHAQARNVHISVIFDNDQIEASIEDDGIGFNVYQIENSGMGLLSIKSRILQLHGQFEIESSPGKGCCIQFSLPVKTQ